jgi:hypothetical protein
MVNSQSLVLVAVGFLFTLLVGEPTGNQRLSFLTFNAELVPQLADGAARKLTA